MSNRIKKAMALISALTLCAGTMTACADKTQELIKLVDAGDFKGAYDYYDEEIDGTNKENDICDEFADEMEDRYEDITDKCFEGEYDEDDIEDLVELLEDTDVDEDDYVEHYAEWQTAFESKRNYDSAIGYVREDGAYDTAIEFLQLVHERDSNYNDAMELIEEYKLIVVENELDIARIDIDNGYFEDAAEILDYYREEYSDNEDIMQTIEEYDILLEFGQLRIYVENNHYNYALHYANEYMSKYADDGELYSQANDAYQQTRDSMNDVIFNHLDSDNFYSAAYYYSYARSYYTPQDFESLVAIVDEVASGNVEYIAESCFSDYEYTSVKDSAQNLVQYFPECENLSQICENLEDAYVEKVIGDAAELKESGDITGAMAMLKYAMDEFSYYNEYSRELDALYQEYLKISSLSNPDYVLGMDISDRLTSSECMDSSIYYRCGGWFMGDSVQTMTEPFTYEELSHYEYINIGYRATYYEGEYLFPMFMIEHTETYTHSDGTQDNLRTAYLCPTWLDYGPKEDSDDYRGWTYNAEEVYTQYVDPSGAGVLSIPTSALLACMNEDDIINQLGIAHGGTILDVGEDFVYEIYVTSAYLS